MATSSGTSNLKKPWAWLAAVAVFGIVLASSTALYVVNPSVKMPLPWWTALAAPLIVYALVLPLCVPRVRLGGWLAGLLILAVLHVGIVLSTAWLYAIVGFTSFGQALPSALWGFPPALVLAMVGSLVMTLPFLGSLAPRAAAARPQPASAPSRPGATKKPSQAPPEIIPTRDRQAWARGPAGPEPAAAAVAHAVIPPVATVFAAPTRDDLPPPLQERPPVEEYGMLAPDEPAVHAAPLLGSNGGTPEAQEAEAPVAEIDDLPPTSVADFRQALSELFGTPAAPSSVDELLAPPADLVLDALVADEPTFGATVAAVPAAAEAVVRIPFDQVVGQLPPGVFRVPLGQVGARLQETETLVVPLALIVPQLGEGVVQVAWAVVAEQFPAEVFAVAPAEVKEWIVDGRLLLPLEEIVRQLPPDVFAAIGRGPVEVPGIEGFPVPFKPLGWEEAPLVMAPPPGEPEPLSIEVPDAAEVARDLALTPPESDLRMPAEPSSTPMEEIKAVAPPSEPELAAASLLEEAHLAEPVEPPQNVVEIEEVSDVLDLDRLLESTPMPAASETQRVAVAELMPPVQLEPPDALVPAELVPDTRVPDALVADEPTFGATVAAVPAAEAVVRIPFDQVVGQLPPGVFRVPLGQVGARLRETETLVVPLALIVPQLGEGVVQVAWAVVAEQFPAEVFAVAPAEVKEWIVDGRLLLPLEEIVRQLPPDVFAAIGRGPVEVPGIEGFPVPFKPLGWEAPLAAAPAPPAPSPTVAEPESTPAPMLERESVAASVETPDIETRALPEPEAVQLEPRGNAEKLAALLVPWETAALGEVQAGDFAIISVSAAGLAGDAVAAAAGRLSPVIARRAPRPVEQATLRGAGGTLVLTPVGSGWKTGMALAVGLRPGGALARLEILARRAAAAHDPRAQVVHPRDAMPVTALDTAPPPAAAAAAARDLDAFGPLQGQSYREPTSGVLIHCFVPPGASAAELASFAWELAQAMAQGPQTGPLGSFDSAVLRSGTERVEIRRLPSATGPAPVLVVGGADTGRPGLARLQVERASARLGT